MASIRENEAVSSHAAAGLDDRGLKPGDDPRVGPTRFKDWLGRSVSRG